MNRKSLLALFGTLVMLAGSGFASERKALTVELSVDGLSGTEKVRVPVNLRGGIVGGIDGVTRSHPVGKPSSYSWHLRAYEGRDGRVVLHLSVSVRYDDGSEKTIAERVEVICKQMNEHQFEYGIKAKAYCVGIS